MNRSKYLLIIYSIILIGSIFRFSYINWDNNSHMHPDERAIILSILQIEFPNSIEQFLKPENRWNPQFFAYGSLPFYLLRLVGYLLPNLFTYDYITLVGRSISGLFDIGTIFIIFLIGRKIKNNSLGLLSSLFYSLSVLPIQLSHFYAVDTPLTFFITLSLFATLLLYKKITISKALLMGFSFGAALASKISAIVLIFPYSFVILINFIYPLIQKSEIQLNILNRLLSSVKEILIVSITIAITSLLFFLFLEPYALIDFSTFWRQTLEQQAMTRDAFTFPYTLQYVGKIPYIFEVKNILMFGLGIPLGLISFSGLFYVIKLIFDKNKKIDNYYLYILLIFFFSYFLIVGNFAVGFMRYMLPLYPILVIFGAILTFNIWHYLSNKLAKKTLTPISIIFILSLFIWPISFLQIYSKPNTRIQATNWIHRNIPPGSTIAIEHWDDAVPIRGQENFSMLTLPLYDSDTSEKWFSISQTLNEADYIILASNRLYVPLQKLNDCKSLPQGRCYLKTALYYKHLFDGTIGFEKIAEFNSNPTIPFIQIQINDQNADESFTVYDHPKVIIFKKVKALPQNIITM